MVRVMVRFRFRVRVRVRVGDRFPTAAVLRRGIVRGNSQSGDTGGVLLATHTAGFHPSNINHELCHYADDVTYTAGFHPQQRREPQ
jgi:hypothetical protein